MERLTPAGIAEHDVDAGSLDIHYAELPADRPPMLLLHGIGMDWRVWQAVARRLSPHFHLFMPDLRGHGQSAKPVSGYGLADYARDVEVLLDELDLHGVILVGSSLGGMVAIVLETPSETIAGRILVDPPLVPGRGPVRPIFLRIQRIKQSGLPAGRQETAILQALGHHREGVGGAFLRYMARCWVNTAAGVLEEALNPVETEDEVARVLAAIPEATMIMRGNSALGSVLSEDAAERAARLMAHGEVSYFPTAGHAIHGSRPAEFVAEILRFAEGIGKRQSVVGG